MTGWEPATEAEIAMRDALRAGDQEQYFRILASTGLLLPVSVEALAGRAPMGWGTWTTGGRTHVLAFTSREALRACLAEHAGSARELSYHELAAGWPNLEWWLAVDPGLPIEGYLPAWFVAQVARGDVRLPTRQGQPEDGRQPDSDSQQTRPGPSQAHTGLQQAQPAQQRYGAAQPGQAHAGGAAQAPPTSAYGSVAGSAGQAGGAPAAAPVPPPAAPAAARPGPGPVDAAPATPAGQPGSTSSGLPRRPTGQTPPGYGGSQGSGFDTSTFPGFGAASASPSAPAGQQARPYGSLASGLAQHGSQAPDPGGQPVSPAPGYGGRPVSPAPGYGGQPVSPAPGYGGQPVSPGHGGQPVSPAPGYGGQPVSPAPGYGGQPVSPAPGHAGQPVSGAGYGARPVSPEPDYRTPPGQPAATPAGYAPPAVPSGYAPPAVPPPPEPAPAAAPGLPRRPAPPDSLPRRPGTPPSSGGLPQRPMPPDSLPRRPGTPPPGAAPAPGSGFPPGGTSAPGGMPPDGAPASAPEGLPRRPVPSFPGAGSPSDQPAAYGQGFTPAAGLGGVAAAPVAPPAPQPGAGRPGMPANGGAAVFEPATAAGTAMFDTTSVTGPLPTSASGRSGSGTATASFVPSNEVEEALLTAVGEGSTDSFLSTLLLAKVLVPVPAGTSNAVLPGEPGFSWRTETIDSDPYVVVFTSPERLGEYFTDPVDTISAKFIQLIKAWPDTSWSFAVNPGTPVGATLPGAQILALATWAADVGLGAEGDPEEETPGAAPDPSERVHRPSPEDPTRPTMMQKVVPPEQVTYYLERGYDRVSGFVHRAAEVAHLRTPVKLVAALGLRYTGSPFSADAQAVHVLRWPAYRPSLYRIPYGGQTEAAMRAMEGWVIERPPFRGNGFAPGDSSEVVAEFKVDSARLPHGAQLWRVGADGTETLVALLDADRPIWRRVGED